MRILLDTSAYSALFRGEETVATRVRHADHVLMVTLLPVTFVTSDRFSRISAALRQKGRPIPTNDIWIAAHATESGAELLSFDHHFEEVEGLTWTQL